MKTQSNTQERGSGLEGRMNDINRKTNLPTFTVVTFPKKGEQEGQTRIGR